MPVSQKKPTRVAVTDSELPLFAAAKRRVALADAAELPRGACVTTGLLSLDSLFHGGFPTGAVTLVAARPKVGATSVLFGAGLAALKKGLHVAYFCDHLREEQLKGRFVMLESRVNGYRFKAGFVSEDDRLAMTAARERIPWSHASFVAQNKVRLIDIDNHLYAYHSHLALIDLQERAVGGYSRVGELLRWVEDLTTIAQRYNVAMVVRTVLPRAEEPPDRLELPGLGALAEAFDTVLLLHREEVTNPDHMSDHALGRAEAQVVRMHGRDLTPRFVPLRFDGRFAGFLDL